MGLFNWFSGDDFDSEKRELTQEDLVVERERNQKATEQHELTGEFLLLRSDTLTKEAQTDAMWKLLKVAEEKARGIRDGASKYEGKLKSAAYKQGLGETRNMVKFLKDGKRK
jgi:hypothetical protein